jgi:hypothetical protein
LFLSRFPAVAHCLCLQLLPAPTFSPSPTTHHHAPPNPGKEPGATCFGGLEWALGSPPVPDAPGVRVQEGAIIRAIAGTNLLRSWIGSRRAGPLQPSKKPSKDLTIPPLACDCCWLDEAGGATGLSEILSSLCLLDGWKPRRFPALVHVALGTSGPESGRGTTQRRGVWIAAAPLVSRGEAVFLEGLQWLKPEAGGTAHGWLRTAAAAAGEGRQRTPVPGLLPASSCASCWSGSLAGVGGRVRSARRRWCWGSSTWARPSCRRWCPSSCQQRYFACLIIVPVSCFLLFCSSASSMEQCRSSARICIAVLRTIFHPCSVHCCWCIVIRFPLPIYVIICLVSSQVCCPYRLEVVEHQYSWKFVDWLQLMGAINGLICHLTHKSL